MNKFTIICTRKSRIYIFAIFVVFLFSGQTHAQQESKYSLNYPADYFRNRGNVINFNPSAHKRIGVLVRNRTNLPLPKITDKIFGTSPFDRYRQFFYFRIEDELREDIANDNLNATRAYDFTGKLISGGKPVDEGHKAFNMVFLNFGPREVIQCSCKGVTFQTNQGNFAYVGEDSILHEIGHAFAGLADEYSHPAASSFTAVNIEDRQAQPIKWNGLIKQGLLPSERIERKEITNGIDNGKFLIPSNNCYMNNHTGPKDNRYCAVCQIAIIERISRLSGVPIPVK